MNREIKFRAWIESQEYDEQGKWKMTYDLAFEQYAPINNLLGQVKHLMQYTSLKDTNQKEIYEGDIIKLNSEFWNGEIGSVEWCDSYGMWRTTIKDKGWMAWGTLTLEMAQRHRIEVIGNIFEHPHLLIKKEEINESA